MSIKFSNLPNPKIRAEDGRVIYCSRSCAVVGEVFLYSMYAKKWYVLLGKRGVRLPDFKGYWCLPCGYLDWGERLDEAVVREVWEETGLLLNDANFIAKCIKSHNFGDKVDRPRFWHVNDEPIGTKQNISFHYGFVFCWGESELPDLSIENAFVGEVEDVRWFTVEDAYKLQLAFNHNTRLESIRQEKKALFDAIEK